MLETVRVEQWLYRVLSQDMTLGDMVGGRIYAYVAPQDAPFPFILISHQAGHDVRGVGPARVMVSLVYQVKVVGQGGSFAPLQPIADDPDSVALVHEAAPEPPQLEAQPGVGEQ